MDIKAVFILIKDYFPNKYLKNDVIYSTLQIINIYAYKSYKKNPCTFLGKIRYI